jgi:hypothetical protein
VTLSASSPVPTVRRGDELSPPAAFGLYFPLAPITSAKSVNAGYPSAPKSQKWTSKTLPARLERMPLGRPLRRAGEIRPDSTREAPF